MHKLVGFYIFYKSLRFIEQIVSVSYFLYNGLFWLVVKHHPAAIVGQLVDALICLAAVLQAKWYMKDGWDRRSDVVSNELDKASDDKTLPDLIVLCESDLSASQKNENEMRLHSGSSNLPFQTVVELEKGDENTKQQNV